MVLLIHINYIFVYEPTHHIYIQQLNVLSFLGLEKIYDYSRTSRK